MSSENARRAPPATASSRSVYRSPRRQGGSTTERNGLTGPQSTPPKQCDTPSEVSAQCGVLSGVWDGQGLTLSIGPLKVGWLPRIRSGMLLCTTSPDGLPGGGMLVCGCLLRTQQCVELVCSELVVLCQFDDCASMCPRPRLWCRGLLEPVFVGEFDPGSGRTLAACLTHASRAVRPFGVHERRTGE